MITVTAEQKAIIEAPGRTFRASLIFGNVEYDGVASFLHTQSLAPNGGITIGEAISASLEVETTDDISNAQGVEFAAQYALEDGSEDGLSFPLGLFYADKPVKSGSLYKLTAYDRMVKAEKVTYQSELTYPANTTAIFNEIVTKAGFPDSVVTPSNSYTIEKDALSGYNCRQALAYLAAYMGCNCFVNKDGDFAMLDYTAVSKANFNLSDNTMDVPDIGEGTVTVNNLLCAVDEETTLSSGTAGGKAITFVCPFMTQSQLGALISKFNGSGVALYNYSTATISQLCGDPRIELGDVIVMTHNGTDYNVPVMQLVRDFDGGLWVKIDSFDTAPVEGLTATERIDLALRAVKNPSKYAAAAAEFSELINNAIGMYTTTETLPDGSTKMYIHDKPTLAASTYIATINSNGFATTNDWNNGKPVWTTGIDRNGNAIMKLLTVYKLRAEQIEAGAITIGGLSHDVIDFINQGGEQDDGIDVHGTAGTLTGDTYAVTTEEQPEEFYDGMRFQITFPNGIDFEALQSGAGDSTQRFKARYVSIDGGTTIGTDKFQLLNANGSTNYCDVKAQPVTQAETTVCFVIHSDTSYPLYSDGQKKLCEMIKAEDVIAVNAETATGYGDYSTLDFDPELDEIKPGLVVKCDFRNATFKVSIYKLAGETDYKSPVVPAIPNQIGNLEYLEICSSKSYFRAREDFTNDYSASDFTYLGQRDGTSYYTLKNTDTLYIIYEYIYSTDYGLLLMPFELRYEPVELVPRKEAVDHDARNMTTELRQKLINLCTAENMTLIDGGNVFTDTLSASDAMLNNILACTGTITGLLKVVGSVETEDDPTEISTIEETIAEMIGFTDYSDYYANRKNTDIWQFAALYNVFVQVNKIPNSAKIKLQREIATGCFNTYCALTLFGLVSGRAYPPELHHIDNYLGEKEYFDHLSLYSYDCSVAGNLFTQGRQVPKTYAGDVGFTVQSGAAGSTQTVNAEIYGVDLSFTNNNIKDYINIQLTVCPNGHVDVLAVPMTATVRQYIYTASDHMLTLVIMVTKHENSSGGAVGRIHYNLSVFTQDSIT